MLAHCGTWPQRPSQCCKRTRCSHIKRPEISSRAQRASASFICCHGSGRGASRTIGGGGGAATDWITGGGSGTTTAATGGAGRARIFCRLGVSVLAENADGMALKSGFSADVGDGVCAAAGGAGGFSVAEDLTRVTDGSCVDAADSIAAPKRCAAYAPAINTSTSPATARDHLPTARRGHLPRNTASLGNGAFAACACLAARREASDN